MGIDDEATGLPGEVNEPRPDLLEEIISGMYSAEGDFEDVDLISHADMVDSVRGVIIKVNSTAVYDMMSAMGFASKTIEGTVYWLVYST